MKLAADERLAFAMNNLNAAVDWVALNTSETRSVTSVE